MFKKIISVFLILAFLLSASGCSGVLRRKFVREKQHEKKQTPVFKPKSYESEFTKEQRYINHFTSWKNAQREIIGLLGQESINNKKLRFYAAYAVEEINEMNKLLPEEKQQQIKPYIEQLADVAKDIKNSSYISSHKQTSIKKLKHIYNGVTRNFSYAKMKGFL